jgi:iron complex outermembrane receptor protein
LHRPSVNIATAVCAALRALSVCAPATLLDSPVTFAATAHPTALTADIASKPLAQALAEFTSQTGLQLVYVSEVVHGRKSRAVSAGLSVNEALARLLQGTGLRFEYLTPISVGIFAAEAPAAGPEQPRTVPVTRGDDELQEIIVSANRREESLQDVPIAMQVLTGDTLTKLNATTLDDYLKYLPGVTAHGIGPGQNNIYVRGLATAVSGIQGAGSNGSFPNVAVYLDEQSAQLPYRNLDVYAADLERIEVLEGPQGTLFGAGAQAGVVRYITNKPKLDVTEGSATAGYGYTAHGDPNWNVEAMINLPLIPDTLAVRGVIYKEERGGYINNVPGTFTREDTDLGIRYAIYPAVNGACPDGGANNGYCVPPGSPSINNASLVGNAINPVTYSGIRLEALFKVDDDWRVLVTQSYQNMQADGVFAEMAANSLGQPLPALTVQLYNPSYDKDKFENTALTIDGRAGDLSLVYAGSYLVRNVDQVQDYTAYARSSYADYYQCGNKPAKFGGTSTPATARCFSPSSTWHDQEGNTHLSQELRLSTPADWRIRGVGGLFYEDYRIMEQVDWLDLTATPYFSPIGPPTGYYTLNGSPRLPNGEPVLVSQNPPPVFVSAPVTLNNPNIRPSDDGFFEDITRGYTQKAAYLSVDFDLVPSTLTLTVGTRYSDTDASEVGASVGSRECQLINRYPPTVPNPCVNHSNLTNLNALDLNRGFAGFRSRAGLSWKMTQDALLYYSWSQGFRAGGFNQGTPFQINSPLSPGDALWQEQAKKHGGWVPPLDYAPDTLINNEVGWKTMWLESRIQWNGAIYQENWNNAQVDAFNRGVLGSVVTTINGGNYRVRGIESFGAAHVTSGLTLEGGANWNHSELIKEASFQWADGSPIKFPLSFSPTQIASGQLFSNPAGSLGTPLAGAPPFQGNVRVRYEFPWNDYHAFVQSTAAYQSHSLASTNSLTPDVQGNSTAYELSGFTTYDGAVGLGKGGWLVQLVGTNLTDTRGQLFANYAQWYKAVTVSRPRTVGLRFSCKFGGDSAER